MPILHWLNREESLTVADKTPYRVLEEVPSLSRGEEGTQNMLVQGDNLDALKSLLPYYAGQVKCIYIDPPYNTGNAFEHYDDNVEHSQWLTLMFPRLVLLREFLARDGVIWISIDDREGHYLKVICDEIFGRANFVADIAWRSSDSSNHDATQFSVDYNATLVYAKTSEWVAKKLSRKETDNGHYKNPDNDPKGPWFPGNLQSPNPRENLRYAITSPTGYVIQSPKNGWRWSKERLETMIQNGEVIFTNGGKKILRKTYLCNQKGMPPSTIWWDIEETGHNRQAKYELKKLFPETPTAELFKTPKPEKLIKRIFEISTDEGDIVMDAFLGSGTTAAVAHKMGRQYIGVEMGEQAVSHCVSRLEKVIDGEQGGISKSVGWQGGGGFRFYRLGETVFDEYGEINPDISFDALASHIWFTETYQPRQLGAPLSTCLGVHQRTAFSLLYNGVLKDRSVSGGNVLTRKTLSIILEDIGEAEYDKIVVYGESCRLSPATLQEYRIVFKQTPYDVRS